MSNAVMRPYGGLINGSPCTFGPPPPPSPPPPPAGPRADHRRREDRSDLVARCHFDRFLVKRRREIDQIVRRHTLSFEWRRFGHERLRRRVPLARHRALLDRPLFDRPDRFAGDSI